MTLSTLARALHAEAERQAGFEAEGGMLPMLSPVEFARGVEQRMGAAPERGLATFRISLAAPWLGPDAKTEYVVTITESLP